jgi:hypothetical protein
MAEVLVRFTESVLGPDGVRYAAQACGGIADDGLWEGWIEFGPLSSSGPPIRTPRETEQPNRDALVYWAEGLTAAYLEGAVRRALDALVAAPVVVPLTEPSVFPGPVRPAPTVQAVRSHSVLDPFSTYAQGEGILRQQLRALSRDHLVTLIDAYRLTVIVTDRSSKEELTEGIIRAVRQTISAA